MYSYSPLLQTVFQACERHPEKIALIAGKEEVTYSELCCSIRQAAALIRLKGFMAGEVIKLAAVKEPHFVYMALGAMMAGVVAEMIDPQSDDERFGYLPEEIFDMSPLAMPLHHGFGLRRLYLSLMNGATAVLLPSIANVKLLLNTIEACQVTSLGLSPAAWRYIRKISGTRIAKFASQLRHIEFGTSAMSLETKQDVLAMFPHARICDNYGLTESNRSTSLELHDTAHLNSIGKPIADSVCVKVIDGEICVQGRQTMVGYWDAEDNEEAFVDGFVRTGDCGYVAEDGYVYLTGRMKEMINVGGEKVSPAEVEETICRLGVGDCVCVSYPHEMLGETVKAFILKGSTNLTIEQIDDRLRSILPLYKCPTIYEWIDAIPLNALGKKQRRTLKHRGRFFSV